MSHPKITMLLKNIFVRDPHDRWGSEKVLLYCQEEFVLVIQKFWKGALERKRFLKRFKMLLKA